MKKSGILIIISLLSAISCGQGYHQPLSRSWRRLLGKYINFYYLWEMCQKALILNFDDYE